MALVRTGRCLQADCVETPAQPAFQAPASRRTSWFGAIQKAPAAVGEGLRPLAAIGSDRGQLASPANGRTTAFAHDPSVYGLGSARMLLVSRRCGPGYRNGDKAQSRLRLVLAETALACYRRRLLLRQERAHQASADRGSRPGR